MPIYFFEQSYVSGHSPPRSAGTASHISQPLPDDLITGPFSPLWQAWLKESGTRKATHSSASHNCFSSMSNASATPPSSSTVMPAESDGQTASQHSVPSYQTGRSGPPTFTLALAAFVAVALVGKTFGATRRATLARHEAESWRRVAIRLVDRGEGRLSPEEIDQVRQTRWARRGCPPRAPAILNPSSKSNSRAQANIRSTPEERRPSSDNQTLVNDGLTGKRTETEQLSSKDHHSDVLLNKPRRSTSSRFSSLFSPIHPHEDWDWTPSDWPPSRSSWRRNRLPPWSIGFTNAARADTNTQRPTDSPRKGIEAAIEAHQADNQVEEMLFQSAVWPDMQTYEHAGESAFVADEVVKEVLEKQARQIKVRKKVSDRKVQEAPETISECRKPAKVVDAAPTERPTQPSAPLVDYARVQALERQVWALMARIEDLERFGHLRRRF